MLVIGGTDRIPPYDKEHDVNFIVTICGAVSPSLA